MDTLTEEVKELATNGNELIETPPQQKKRGRPSKGSKKGYFYKEEDDAFRKYVKSTDRFERDRIFKDKLYPAFTKMIESIIRRYNLFTPDEDFADTFYDTMSFLLTKVNNFDFSRGKKVYSYCGTVCKNYLIMKRIQYIKNNNKLIPYETFYNDANPDDRAVDNTSIEKITFAGGLINRMIKDTNDILSRADEFSLTNDEIKVGRAVVYMLENWDYLFSMNETQKFNKNNVVYFIKEYTMLTTKEVREALRIYKDLYFLVKGDYVDKLENPHKKRL